MTTKQKLEIRRSEIRSRLGEIAALDDLTEETRTEQTGTAARVPGHGEPLQVGGDCRNGGEGDP